MTGRGPPSRRRTRRVSYGTRVRLTDFWSGHVLGSCLRPDGTELDKLRHKQVPTLESLLQGPVCTGRCCFSYRTGVGGEFRAWSKVPSWTLIGTQSYVAGNERQWDFFFLRWSLDHAWWHQYRDEIFFSLLFSPLSSNHSKTTLPHKSGGKREEEEKPANQRAERRGKGYRRGFHPPCRRHRFHFVEEESGFLFSPCFPAHRARGVCVAARFIAYYSTDVDRPG